MKLTAKQERFCEEYIVDSNSTQAAIRAGYSKRSAKQIGSINMTKHDVMVKITRLRSDLTERVKVDSEWVLTKSIELHDLCIGEKQYNTAAKALDTIGKHINVQAFNEKSEIVHKGSIGIDTTSMGDEILQTLFERRRDEQRSEQVH